MKQNEYPYEGQLINSEQNRRNVRDAEALAEAMRAGTILEGRVFLCDNDKSLHVSVGPFKGVIPREECVYAQGNAYVKDIAIISRVGKPVCFRVTDLETDGEGNILPILSRKAAQRACMHEHIEKLLAGDVVDAKITHLDSFGAFADIGCGVVSLMPIDCMSVSRISHPRDRFSVGQVIRAVVKNPTDEFGRVTLTHRELLGTWEENAARFTVGQTADGIIRSVESYGVFVELTPNLAGLAEYRTDAEVGRHAAVYIKNIIPEKMKLKLSIIDVCDGDSRLGDYVYPEVEHIDYWRYSPECCEKLIESVF